MQEVEKNFGVFLVCPGLLSRMYSFMYHADRVLFKPELCTVPHKRMAERLNWL
jgi:hypothetical protein